MRWRVVKDGKFLTMDFRATTGECRWWWGPAALAYSWETREEAAEVYEKVKANVQNMGGGEIAEAA